MHESPRQTPPVGDSFEVFIQNSIAYHDAMEKMEYSKGKMREDRRLDSIRILNMHRAWELEAFKKRLTRVQK